MEKRFIDRYLAKQVKKDLKQKMVFVAGPRQVGKTTMVQMISDSEKGYLNWDIPEHREKILKRELPDEKLLIFDELHKYRSWRNYLKGLYDKIGRDRKILVTGSARLDYYRFGGDSLQGRYHFLRLHPLSVAELKIKTVPDLKHLLNCSGFPEPFFYSSKTEVRRWSREYRTRLIQDDIRSLENVKDLGNIELLCLRLPELVGSPLSINSLREDLQVSHKTVSNWLMILERLYGIIRISPFGAPKIRAVKKEQKHYHYDWTLVKDESKRFENMVALHLLKWIHYMQDIEGRDFEFRYFRDIDGREVDFVIMEDLQPVYFIEAKWNDAPVSKGLVYLKKRFKDTVALQISAIGKKNYITPDNIKVCPALTFLSKLV